MKKFIHRLTSRVACLALYAVLAFSLQPSAFAQGVPPSGTFSVATVTLPYSTIAAGAAGSTGTSTNLAAGWSSLVSVTNTSTTWNSTSNAFVTTTNVVSATNTVYALMSTINQKDLTVSVGFNASGTTGTQNSRVLTFARYLDSSTIDTINTWTMTIAAQGITNVIASTNFPAAWIGGAGGVALISDLWGSTNAVTMTNNFIKYGHKSNAF
jgi:hypothetical protein